MSQKYLRWGIGGIVIVLFSVGLFVAGFVSGVSVRGLPALANVVGSPSDTPIVQTAPQVNTQVNAGEAEDIDQTFAPFWEAWDLLHEEFVEQPLDDTKLMQGAIRGMMEASGDKHTSYMDPGEYQLFMTGLSGQLEGIGAYVDTTNDTLSIVSPLPGSPAEAAGLLPGDKIIKVDGEDVTGLPGTEVIFKVRGPAGTTVHLEVEREGHADLLKFEVVRARITIPSVETEMLDDGIAYVKINEFGDQTAEDLIAALKPMMEQNPKGLVLDLRNNGGGYLSSAVSVASQFLPDGRILIERYGDGREVPFDVERGGLATGVPMVVLINKGSASASEIVAGAIQDHDRGLLVGETSYGKGSVQLPHELDNDQGAVRITVAYWLTPNGRHIQDVGLTPDKPVELSDADRQAKLDPQLDAAVELLK